MSDHPILALDLGTSSVRALVLDGVARPLPGALARRPVTVAVDDDGSATLDGPSYVAALIDCLDELATAGRLDGVALVAASSQWHSVLPVDASGSPLGPVLTWLDGRPTAPAGARPPADEDAFHQRTGAWWHPLYWTVRLPWLRSRLGPSIGGFRGLTEFVLGALLEEAPMSVSVASGTGLLDIATLQWDAEAIELAAVRPGELPPLAPADWRGRLRPQFARRWPALSDAGWAPPTGDGAASNVGSDAADVRRVGITVGTSAAVRVVQDAPAGQPLPHLPAGLWRYRVDQRRTVSGVAFSAGGNIYAWARPVLRLPEGPELEAALVATTPDDLPWADPRLGGDRPPGRLPPGSGELRGIGFATTAVEIFAALMEGVCRQVAAGLGEIESTLDGPVEVMLGGGAAAASAWLRAAFERKLAPRRVIHVGQPEVGATGAALVAIGRA
ncbi:MAG TPA: FGGY family carbohydrate kinase [Micromonosporaceae bacterium]|jgi:gluconokinase